MLPLWDRQPATSPEKLLDAPGEACLGRYGPLLVVRLADVGRHGWLLEFRLAAPRNGN